RLPAFRGEVTRPAGDRVATAEDPDAHPAHRGDLLAVARGPLARLGPQRRGLLRGPGVTGDLRPDLVLLPDRRAEDVPDRRRPRAERDPHLLGLRAVRLGEGPHQVRGLA